MKKRILIVEDNPINAKMLSQIVSSAYEVVEASNGQEALAILEKQYARISLILLDIVMPVMNGYEFLQEQKKNPDFSSIPVIVATEHHSENEEIAALACGATEFVIKPYQPQIIMRRIKSILKLKETSAMIGQLQYDRLTGLYSKDYFYQYAREIIARNPDVTYDFVSMNIENFHLFNDRYGTKAGDGLLRVLADTLKELFPEERTIIARLYADQFIGMTAYKGEGVLSGHIARFHESLREKCGVCPCTLKWGVYRDEKEGFSVEKMCDNAILAARSIKGQYGVSCCRFDRKLKEQIIREQNIIDEMEKALEEEEFEIYLQPKVRAEGFLCMDAEALVRWNHPMKGILSPGLFIPVFEKTGFISKLDRYVWKKTCELLRRWSDMGYGELNVSVNMSPADIADSQLIDYLMNLVNTYRIHPSQLHLEVTETACTDSPEETIAFVSVLRDKGFKIEMDDFGSGYSSMNMVMQMPLDVLKLDRILIQNEFKRKGSLRYIIGLAHWLDMQVVAEGVETKEQMEYMRELGCDYIQGYYMAAPMHWKDFEAFLKKQRGVQKWEQGSFIKQSDRIIAV